MRINHSDFPVPINQVDAYLSQANPVSTTLYPVLPPSPMVRLLSLNAQITWAVTQPTPLEIVVTIDGIPMIFQVVNPPSGALYFAAILGSANALNQVLTNDATTERYRSHLIEGRLIQVDVRVTWAVTQPTPLVCRVKWERW